MHLQILNLQQYFPILQKNQQNQNRYSISSKSQRAVNKAKKPSPLGRYPSKPMRTSLQSRKTQRSFSTNTNSSGSFTRRVQYNANKQARRVKKRFELRRKRRRR